MLRGKGQKSLICDVCGLVYDDRPRDKSKDVVKEAQRNGWRELAPPEMYANGLHWCPDCWASGEHKPEEPCH